LCQLFISFPCLDLLCAGLKIFSAGTIDNLLITV
jgi:hypothetical protein